VNVLTFSASPRKIWVDQLDRMLNPSFWLLGALMKRLSYDATVYTITDSMNPCGMIKPYVGQPIDKIVIMGVAYSPANLGSSFKKGYPLHQRAFDIAAIAQRAIARWKPEIVLLTVDVRGWYADASACFGFEPDRVITEQDMRWQEIGYYVAHNLRASRMVGKKSQLGFSGHAKLRYEKMAAYMAAVPVPVVIHGGGWDKPMEPLSHVKLCGTQDFIDSARMLSESQFGFVLHEPMGEAAGWVTAKFYENLGFECIAFTDAAYDSGERALPADHFLRVHTPDELHDKISTVQMTQSYKAVIRDQNKLIDPRWLDFDGYYYRPFLDRLAADV
jgi:hypothetical protein